MVLFFSERKIRSVCVVNEKRNAEAVTDLGDPLNVADASEVVR